MFRRWKSPYPYDKRINPFNLTVKVVLESHYLSTDGRVLNNEHDCIQQFTKLIESTWLNRVIIASDDPELLIFKAMETKGLMNLTILPDVGNEAFSVEMFNWFKVWLTNSGLISQVDVRAVEVSEASNRLGTRDDGFLYTE
jgi:hypothetical protein